MSDDDNYINSKNKNKSSNDVNVGGFFLGILSGIIFLIIYFYLACLNINLAYQYSTKSMSAQNPFLVPYTPFKTIREYLLYSTSKESFKRFKLSGGMKLPTIDELFPMDSWAFPYKNKLNEDMYEKSYTENMESMVFKFISFITKPLAGSYATARMLLQMYFSGTKQIITSLDDGVKDENKFGELFIFCLGTPLFILSFTALAPLYSFNSVVVHSLFNIKYALPNFLGFNFYTFLYFVFFIPFIINIVYILTCIGFNATFNSVIMPLVYIGFILLPLFNKDTRKALSALMFSKKKIATTLIMLIFIINAYQYLGNTIGIYITIAGILFLLLLFFKVIN